MRQFDHRRSSRNQGSFQRAEKWLALSNGAKAIDRVTVAEQVASAINSVLTPQAGSARVNQYFGTN
jgi:hypothetical protein